MHTIKLLLTEISVHTGSICSDIQGAWTSHSVRSIRLECQNKYFLVWTSTSVNKSILWTGHIAAMLDNIRNRSISTLLPQNQFTSVQFNSNLKSFIDTKILQFYGQSKQLFIVAFKRNMQFCLMASLIAVGTLVSKS